MIHAKEQYLIPGINRPIGYLCDLPADYHTSGKTYPLVIFLHGAGERGNGTDRLEAVRANGFPRYAKEGAEYPFVLISPQCPEENHWAGRIDSLNLLLDHLLATMRVDPDRVCLTGLSMGGMGTWFWGFNNPERFASLIPVCGTAAEWLTYTVVDMPIWAFHGSADGLISCYESIRLCNAVNAQGGHARLTIYPEVGHDSWVRAYQEPALIPWILAQRRRCGIK